MYYVESNPAGQYFGVLYYMYPYEVNLDSEKSIVIKLPNITDTLFDQYFLLGEYIQDVIPEYKREAEVFYEFTSKHFYTNVFIIIFMSIVLIAACYIILKRQLEVKK